MSDPKSDPPPAATPAEEPPWWSGPMNNQIRRAEIAVRIIKQCGIARIVETGTYIGTTTEFFAHFGVPVITAERDPVPAKYATERLSRWKNVEVRPYDSVRMLQELARAPIDRSVPTFFYLDAHWARHLPLREEAEIAVAYFPQAVIMIDDFEVPGDPGYAYDDYGPGKQLTLDYLLQGSLKKLTAYFPRVHSSAETGAKRGCVVATANADLAAILSAIPDLRRWVKLGLRAGPRPPR